MPVVASKLAGAWIVCLWLLCALAASGCSSQKVAPYERPEPEMALEPRGDSAFADLAAAVVDRHGAASSGFRLLDSNADGLRWRLALIDTAKYSIDAQYYLWYGDSVGRLLIRHVIHAADRGVRVRLLVDDLNTLLEDASRVSQRDEVVGRLDSHPNIELRLFNPWTNRRLAGRLGESMSQMKRVNQRMHNKSLIVDNRAVIIGGRNIGDEYMGLNTDFNFRDLDVLAVGPVAMQASAVFDDYWNSDWVLPVSVLGYRLSEDETRAALEKLDRQIADDPVLQAFEAGPRRWDEEIAALSGQLRIGTGSVVSDRPDGNAIDHVMLDKVSSMMRSAERELLIENAYIIPSEVGINTLRELRDRGVTARILTNSLASHDVPAVNSHYRSWRLPIIEAGAELYELRHDPALQHEVSDTSPVSAGFSGLHAKVMVTDRKRAFVGSMNYDPRSAALNTEMGVVISSPELAEELARIIERDMDPANSWQVARDDDGKLYWANASERVKRQPARNWWQRVEDWFFRIFPKELY